eukprot:14865322-Alexandrium_andersonii.AAC.1
MSLPFIPPHELLEAELAEDDALLPRLRETLAEDKLPRAYHENPVVTEATAAGEAVVPLQLYMDGVPYSGVDSVVGLWLVNMISGSRRVIGLVRKRIVCRCG